MTTSDGFDEDAFNMSMRKFLKRVGVTSQQEIGKAVRAAVEAGSAAGAVEAKVTLEIPSVGLVHVVDGRIALAPGAEEA